MILTIFLDEGPFRNQVEPVSSLLIEAFCKRYPRDRTGIFHQLAKPKMLCLIHHNVFSGKQLKLED